MITRVGIVVPVANEQVLLPTCLDALRRTRDHLAVTSAIDVRTVVVLDACTDASATIAARYPEVLSIAIGANRVGAARRAGCAAMLNDASNREQLLLANTDADSAVPRHWLRTLVDFADAGADVIIGTVCPQPGLPPSVRAAWHARYLAAEGHPHVHGANFAIRASSYQRVGGWPDLVTGEDHGLAARAAAAAGVRIIRTAQAPVATSARVVGRAPDGFSSYLRGLLLDDDAGQEPARSSYRNRAPMPSGR